MTNSVSEQIRWPAGSWPSIQNQVRWQFWRQVRWQVWEQVSRQIEDQISRQVRQQVRRTS